MHAGLSIMSSIPVTPPAPTAGPPAPVGADKAIAGLAGFADKLITALTAMQPADTAQLQPATVPVVASSVASSAKASSVVSFTVASDVVSSAGASSVVSSAVASGVVSSAVASGVGSPSVASSVTCALRPLATPPNATSQPAAASPVPVMEHVAASGSTSGPRLRATTLAAMDQPTATLQQLMTVPVVANAPKAAPTAAIASPLPGPLPLPTAPQAGIPPPDAALDVALANAASTTTPQVKASQPEQPADRTRPAQTVRRAADAQVAPVSTTPPPVTPTLAVAAPIAAVPDPVPAHQGISADAKPVSEIPTASRVATHQPVVATSTGIAGTSAAAATSDSASLASADVAAAAPVAPAGITATAPDAQATSALLNQAAAAAPAVVATSTSSSLAASPVVPLPVAPLPGAPLPGASSATAPSPAAQVAPALVALTRAPDGASRLTLRLDPPDLGQVHISIDRPQDAPARVEITVQRQETLTLLLRDQPQLQTALNQAGVPQDGRSITFHLAAAEPSARSDGASLPGSGADVAGQTGNGADGASRQGGDSRQQTADTLDDTDMDFTPVAVPTWLRAGLDITA
jgi:flagellar hook-length control protein FliK